MEPRSVEHLTAGCGGELIRGTRQTPVLRVCTDSRQAQPGDAFFAVPGERFNGHDFLPEVVGKGAAAVVVEKPRAGGLPGDCAVIAVENTRAALGRYASHYREAFHMPVVAVAGSNGKTSTKELIASVLRQKLKTAWSEASFNNDIGVPLTLLQADATHQALVVEAGTNHPGELAALLRIIRPRYGVITCIGREHLEFFGDLDGVAREEGSLAELLPAEGKLLVNGDDTWTPSIVRRAKAGVIRVGLGPGNDWTARAVRLDKAGVSFQVDAPDSRYGGEYRILLLGRHQAVNALFAVALGAELGCSREEIGRGLAECKPAKMRLQLWEWNDVRVIDDAYNANADSMLAALQTLRDLPCRGRRIAVLGDMAELGAQSEAAHEEVGRRAAELGVGQLFVVGKWAAAMARGARAGGLHRVIELAEVEAAADAVRRFLKAGDILLLKASRSSRLERIAELLKAGEGGRKN